MCAAARSLRDVSYRGAGKLFGASLGKVSPLLREGGYCGYINRNMMANEDGLWPLEFTSRFGYPGFAVGVVLTVPPFPYSQGYEDLSKGELICFHPGMTAADRAALHFAEVARLGDHLVTSGASGYVGVATGTGETVQAASDEAYRLARKVVLPNLRYRNDIGRKVAQHDLARLQALGWF